MCYALIMSAFGFRQYKVVILFVCKGIVLDLTPRVNAKS